MTDKLALIKRLARTKTSDVMHSSGYADAQNSGNFGTSSGQSFTTRQSIEQQRKYIRGYHNSRIMGRAINNAPHAKTFTPPPDKKLGPNPPSSPGASTKPTITPTTPPKPTIPSAPIKPTITPSIKPAPWR